MQDPLKQGLKPIHRFLKMRVMGIRMQDPLKQGLKHKPKVYLSNVNAHSNARSTKTRIETSDEEIEINTKYQIRMQDPLKQGLKHSAMYFDTAGLMIRMQDPLKQGLKLDMQKACPLIFVKFECKIH